MNADAESDFYEGDEPLSKLESTFAQGQQSVTRHPSAVFEIYEFGHGQYRWRLKSADGRTAANSEVFATKEAAIASIESIRREVVHADLTVV